MYFFSLNNDAFYVDVLMCLIYIPFLLQPDWLSETIFHRNSYLRMMFFEVSFQPG